jgi:hypothetical protein
MLLRRCPCIGCCLPWFRPEPELAPLYSPESPAREFGPLAVLSLRTNVHIQRSIVAL